MTQKLEPHPDEDSSGDGAYDMLSERDSLFEDVGFPFSCTSGAGRGT